MAFATWAFASGLSRSWVRAAVGLALLSAVSAPAIAQSTDAEEDVTVGQLARHYRVYQRDMDALEEMSFTSVSELRSANDLILSYEPPNLTRGWYAHNALVAARSPGFMAAVRDRAQRSGTDTFLAEAGQNPSYLWNISSQTAALNRVLNGVWSDTREATAVGRVLNSRAYAYMDRSYGGRLPSDAAANATDLIEADAAAMAATADGRIYVPYRAQHVMQRVLEIAARLSVDRSGTHTSATGLIFPQEETNRCLRWAQLNLAQCLAASRSPAEEAYCTGRHGVDDVADCWGWMVETSAEADLAATE